MKCEKIYLYDDRPDVTLTTYIWDESPELQPGQSRPAVIVCPGGAYLNCSDREGEPIALKFMAMGYQAFVLRYSTYLEGKGGFPEPGKPLKPKPERSHPTPVREIGKAFLILREHAEEWHVDMDKVAVCGFSAGAHNSAMYSVYWNKPEITEFYGRPAEDFRPAAIILGYTLSDYHFMKETEMDFFAKFLFDACNTALTGTPEPDDATMTAVSPARLVDENTPPTFLWATAADNLVPVQHSLRMAHALADHKIPFEMHIYEEGAHGLSTADQASASDISQVNMDAAGWMEEVDQWLAKRFALSLPEPRRWEM